MAGENLDKSPERKFWGHSRNDDGNGTPELLRDHLRGVAERAAEFASAFSANEQAHAAGILHDLGKYADQFQRRLIDSSERGRDHWSAGAVLLPAACGSLGIVPALAVAGHHVGLKDLPFERESLCRELLAVFHDHPDDVTESERRVLHERFAADGFRPPGIQEGLLPSGAFASDMLDVRMLFSALVDADFLETEAHFMGDAATPRRPRVEGPGLDVDRAIEALNGYVERMREQHRGEPMAAVRDELMQACIGAASKDVGLYTLAAPTGAGKTLALLAFALHHAKRNGLRRVVLVMPFLNIIEQTALIYRQIFSEEIGFAPNTVLEHHSLSRQSAEDAIEDDSSRVSRLLAENWDAPVILTTSVQFLESLMSSRPSRCRKLHRLAQSVILFDEVQTIPVKLAVPTLANLSRLAEANGPYRSSVVFATATQPAFECLEKRVQEFAGSGWKPVDIAPHSRRMYGDSAKRVKVQWRHAEPIFLDNVAIELAGLDRVLCIVNLKRHAAALAQALADDDVDGLLHLSTSMCPAHRTEVLRLVDMRLDNGLPLRLIATQCVEAGVDLDFPVVYRALAPMESIAQAAGRCNRHGRERLGRVVVFKPEDERGIYPPGYEEAANATEIFLAHLALNQELDATEIISAPDVLQAYFQSLYDLTGRTTSERSDEAELFSAIRAGDFETTAKLYRLIKQDTVNVVVPYDRSAFNQLNLDLSEADRLTPELIRRWCRNACQHAVSLFRPKPDATIWNHLAPVQFSRRREVDNEEADWFFALPGLEYDSLVGIREPEDNLMIL